MGSNFISPVMKLRTECFNQAVYIWLQFYICIYIYLPNIYLHASIRHEYGALQISY